MSIQLLSQDAKGHIANQISRINELLSKWRHTAKTVLGKERNFEIQPNIAELEAGLHAYQNILAQHAAWEESERSPIQFSMTTGSAENIFEKRITGVVFLYQNAFYAVAGPYTAKEASALLVDYIKKKKRKVEFLVAREDVSEADQEYERKPIPEEVRHEVWRRDKARCVNCGSVRNLEYDHLIPVSRGGGNTARNIQLLCEECNRRKGDRL